jgi:hypothetical protein
MKYNQLNQKEKYYTNGKIAQYIDAYIVPERKNLFSKKPAHYQEIFF